MIDLHRKKSSKGFTLLEVLVAMVLLSIGLLGVARLQMFGLQNTGNAYFRTQASGLLTEMVERVRANPDGALNDAYNLVTTKLDCPIAPLPPPAMPPPAIMPPPTLQLWSNYCDESPTADCSAAICSTAEMAQFDMYVVNCGLSIDPVTDVALKGEENSSGVDDLLPCGQTQIYCSNLVAAAQCDQYVVSVSWSETNDDDADGAGDTNTISLAFTP